VSGLYLDNDYGDFVKVNGLCYERKYAAQIPPDFIGGPDEQGFVSCIDCVGGLTESSSSINQSTSSATTSSSSEPTSSSENDGNVANFNGTNHYFSSSSNSEFQLPDDMNWAFSMWVRPDNISGTQSLISKYNDSVSETAEYFIRISELGRIKVGVLDINGSFMVDGLSQNPLAIGELSHVVVTSDGVNREARIYINGGLEDIIPFFDDLHGSLPRQSTSDFQFGARSRTTKDLFYDGAMFSINYWHRNLEDSDVNIIYNNGQPYDCACVGEIIPTDSSSSSDLSSQSIFSASSSSSESSLVNSSSSSESSSTSNAFSGSSSSSSPVAITASLISCWDLAGDSLDKIGSNDMTNNNTVPFDRFQNLLTCENSSSSL